MQTVAEAEQRADEQGVHQAADLVDGEFEQPGVWRVAGGGIGGADRQDSQGGQRKGGEPVPGVPAADLMRSRPTWLLAAWNASSTVHRIPATRTSWARLAGCRVQQR
jgi:hypothetical protein